jgi:hypothetical protein
MLRTKATDTLRIFLVNDQRGAQFFSMYLFLYLTLYMFRAHRAHHQERQIVSTQPLVTVTLYRWPCRVQVGSALLTIACVILLFGIGKRVKGVN